MGVIDSLKYRFSNSPEMKGQRFEDFIESRFSPKYFNIVEKTHSFKENSDRYIESSLNPDFTFRYMPTGETFAVECKYRSELYKGKLSWCNENQLKRYNDFQTNRQIPVFIAVGLGGKQLNPDRLFCIPLSEAKYPNLFPSVFERFEKKPDSYFFWKNKKLS